MVLYDGLASAQLDYLGEDAHRDFFFRTSLNVQARRGPHLTESFSADPSFAHVLKNPGRLYLTGYESYIGSIRFERLFERLFIALSLCGHDDESLWANPNRAEVEIRLHSVSVRITLPIGLVRGD